MEIVLCAVAVIAVVALAVLAWLGKTDMEQMAEAQVVPISSVPEGSLVRIVGQVVRAEDLLRSPLGETPCVAWQVSLESRRQGMGLSLSVGPVSVCNRRNDGLERTVRSDWVTFYVDDGTGRALVRTDGLFAVFKTDAVRTRGLLEELPPNVTAFMRGLLVGGAAENTALNWSECTFTEGETLSV